MTAPLSEFGQLGPRGVLVAGFVIGIGFGACLERSGLGSARKLMGQFTLKDLAVFKVMFSAIVTAMLGLFWLSRFGVLDLERVYLPETFLLPQLVGGLVFGVGFALAGLCPGTSCVAAATGRVDGLAVMIGMFAGVLATGLARPSFATFFASTSRGSFTLPTALGVPDGIVILGIVCLALAGFGVAPRIERAMATRTPDVPRAETVV
ncbi:MAG: YeeE/YedE thiosulfate transporter family protein [bacterium]